jgi:hypothetical protein
VVVYFPPIASRTQTTNMSGRLHPTPLSLPREIHVWAFPLRGGLYDVNSTSAYRIYFIGGLNHACYFLPAHPGLLNQEIWPYMLSYTDSMYSCLCPFSFYCRDLSPSLEATAFKCSRQRQKKYSQDGIKSRVFLLRSHVQWITKL